MLILGSVLCSGWGSEYKKPLKRTVLRDFRHFCYIKNSTWAHMIRQNRFCEFCCFREDIREKLCLHSL